MGRPKTISDEDILTEARAAFLAEGHAVSTRVIAKRVGLSQATLVQRFGTKDALFVAAVQPDVLDVEATLGTKDDALRDGARQYLADVAARLLTRVEQQIPRLLHLRQNPAVTAKTLQRAHARLGVPNLLRQLTERVAWLREQGLLPMTTVPNDVVTLVVTLVHGVAFMNLVAGASPRSLRSKFFRLLSGIDGRTG